MADHDDETHAPDLPDLPDPAARLAELERENAELRRRLRERPTAGGAPTSAPGRSRHRLRATACVVLITLGALLAPLGAVAAWAQRALTDTDRYVATVGPLAADPVVQSAVAGRLTEIVMSRIDVGTLLDDLVAGLEERDVPPRATRALEALEAPLTGGVESLVSQAATRVVESDAFEAAWVQANRVAHDQLVAAMRGDDGAILQVGDEGTLNIQLSGLVELLKDRLVEQGLAIAARVPAIGATFTIAQSPQLVELQDRYAQVVALTTWLPWVALGLLAAGVLVANDRLRALVVAGCALTAAMVLLGLALAVARGLYLDALSGEVVRLDAAEVVFDQVVTFLRLTLRTVGVVGLVLALAAYVGGSSASARGLREGLARGAARTRRWAEGRGVTSGPVGDWVGAHRAFVRAVVLAAAAVVVLLASPPTPGLVVGVAIGAAVVLVVVELVARPSATDSA